MKFPAPLLLTASTLLLASAAPAQDARALFHEAYYLELEQGQLEQALALYRKVSEGRGGDAELRALAAERAAGLVEDLAAGDLARLVPADTIFFAQMDRPGEQFSTLLGQLGLLGEAHRIAEDRIAVSPLLVEHVLGLRGAALALTDLGLGSKKPSGVVLLHPGSHAGLRGLIDTALPAVGQRVESIGGFPVWNVEGEAFVCLTRRLLVASPDLRQVAAVVERLGDEGGRGKASLADDERFAAAMGGHGAGLLSFYLNAEPLKPMMRMLMEQQARNDPGAAMAANMLDLDSLESLSGRVGVDGKGLGLDLALELAEGHRNLVFNLMRRPTVTHETFELVPEGAAFFLATAFNPKAAVAPIATDGLDQPVVSLLDFGRELFGNVVDVAIFGLPEAPAGGGLPDLNLVVRVNDAERSRALWELGLGTLGQATGAGEPVLERVGGADVMRYTIQQVPLYLASQGDRLVLSPNRSSIERALGGGYARSVKQDAVLGGSLAGLDGSSTMLLALCPGRVATMAAPFMSPEDRAEMQPIAALLGETAVMFTTQHSDTRLALSARVEHIPDVSGLVRQAMLQHRAGGARGDDLALEYRAPQAAPRPAVHASGGDMQALRARFDELVGRGDRSGAIGLTQRMVASVGDAKALNSLAWALLTEERYEGAYDRAARTLSVRSNELSGYSEWAYVDTLALAECRAGNLAAAVELQEQVLELAGEDGGEHPELSESLERYRALLAESAGQAVAGS